VIGEGASRSKKEQSMLKYDWSIKSIHVSRLFLIYNFNKKMFFHMREMRTT